VHAADVLFKRGLHDLHVRFEKHWEKLSPDQRQPLVQVVAKEICTWPEDVRRAVLTSLKQSVNVGAEPSY
jgi:hypothetical protein